MRKGGETFPGAGFGRRSTVGRAASSRAALDQDLDSILSGGGNDVLRMMIFTAVWHKMAGDGFDDDNDDNEVNIKYPGPCPGSSDFIA
ncbi:hypothetical protein OS493_027821 [Desmophyllum pertusum]|uniref:Uncharacterized protein n=1 Tax=Desmophyllum pertusum TaxID=174260 RepID=A0A9W9YX28_9CNID|nr:hypothetical protein OS493_027821 [Desmophyllum pertusum]